MELRETATAERRPAEDVLRRVLVVDDDPAIRLLCRINLEVDGMVVVEAVDGRHGLELARSLQPHLVVTDVKMPGLDGFELAEALSHDEQTSRIPVVFLSAETHASNAERARRLGALAYVTKPFDPRAFASLVADATGSTGARSAG